jgi:DNA-binding response OmpR family regulator
MAQEPRHILVVDDSPHIGVLCRMQFEHRGYRVSVAGTLADARRSLATDPPNAVLLDIHLPDGLGLELLGELRQSVVTSDLPVIVLTAEGDEQMLQDSRRLGATVLTKPFSPSKLATRVLTLLGEPPEMPEGEGA